VVGAAEIVCRFPVRPAGEQSGDVGLVYLGVGMENGIILGSQVCWMNRFVVHTTEEFGTDAFEPICCFLRTGFVLLAELCCWYRVTARSYFGTLKV
jgi:hypothetical protein